MTLLVNQEVCGEVKPMARSRSCRVDQLYPKIPRDSEGYWLCRYCGLRIAKAGQHLSWHSRCKHEAYIRVFPNFASRALHAREHGVCRHCGINTDALQSALRILKDAARGCHAWNEPEPAQSTTNLWRDVLSCVASAMKTRGWDIHIPMYGLPSWRRLWNMDHIIEHAEGGSLEPSNLQTLCTPCHKAKTRAYAAEKAQRRRVDKEVGMALFGEEKK